MVRWVEQAMLVTTIPASSLLGGLATVVTLLARSAGRCRPNSTLAGGGRPSTASPGQASPGRGAPSPSRPSTSSIGDPSPHAPDLPRQAAAGAPPTGASTCRSRWSWSRAPSTSTCPPRQLPRPSTCPTINADDKEEEEDFEVHVLTEEPDSEDLEEEVEEAKRRTSRCMCSRRSPTVRI